MFNTDGNRIFKADLHVHTIGSGHGFSTIKENADAAIEKGMELIAMTDHGPSVPQGAHNWFFWNQNHVPGLYNGLIILRGCEANIIPDGSRFESRWGLDVADIVARRLDYVTVGFHPTTGFDNGDEAENTKAAIRAMECPYVDQFNHPGNLLEFPLNVDEVIAAAIEYKVVLEVNNASFNALGARAGSKMMEIEFAAAAFEAGAQLALNSDAHHSTGIGNVEPAFEYATEYGISLDAFINTSAEKVINCIKSKRPRPLLEAG